MHQALMYTQRAGWRTRHTRNSGKMKEIHKTAWAGHEASELNLKNEKEIFKKTVRGRAFQIEWELREVWSYWTTKGNETG